MRTFTLPLPPSVNHMYENNANGSRRKSKALLAWEDEAALAVRGWMPPKRTPLRVLIVLHMEPAKLWCCDGANYEKPITDAVVGKRRDQWVADTRIVKQEADGEPRVVVTVSVLAADAGQREKGE